MLGKRVKWKLVLALAMAVGGSFVAGCCGGPGNHGGGCAACAEAKAAMGAKEGGTDATCGQIDAGPDADAGDSGAD